MLLSFQLGGEVFRDPVFSGAMIAVASSLMVSQLPTPSIKYMRPARQHRLIVWGFVGLLAGFMITWPWITLTIGMVIYLTSIPFGIALQARQKARSRH
jgi:CDP-diacylglycerol---serine O-phosphatidyltransferase